MDPGDVSGLREAIDAGQIDPAEIVAIIGKTHGNGLVNDYTRGYLMMSLSHPIAARTGVTPEAVCERVPFIFSGGMEGVLSPHYAVFTVSPDAAPAAGAAPSLAIGVASTPRLQPQDVGRRRQIDLAAAAVEEAMAKAGIETCSDVHYVQVKGPAFTLADIVAADADTPCASDNPGKLMAFGRAASALGVAKALHERPGRRDCSLVHGRDRSRRPVSQRQGLPGRGDGRGTGPPGRGQRRAECGRHAG
jgi:cyanuric acid amidohydrolase